LVVDAPEALVEPTKPRVPRKPRGVKNKVNYAENMKKYSEALAQYKDDKKSYEDSLDAHTDKVDAAYGHIVLSSRNVKNAKVADAKLLNVYEIMNANCLVLSESAANRLAEMLG
jgi:large subunit ribosomal protein L4